MMLRNWLLPQPNTFASVASMPTTPTKFATVKVRVVRPFYGLRRLLEAGEVVSLAEPDAADAVALGRAERV